MSLLLYISRNILSFTVLFVWGFFGISSSFWNTLTIKNCLTLHIYLISCSRSVKKEMSQNLLQWTVADVASYFSAAGFPEQAGAFRAQVRAPPQSCSRGHWKTPLCYTRRILKGSKCNSCRIMFVNTFYLSPCQEIDGKSLLLMQRSDVLTGLSIRLGPALKIYERHVKVLQRTHFLEYEDLWSCVVADSATLIC